MDFSYEPLDLTLHEPFTIARGTQLVAQNVQVTLSQDGVTGIGEAAPNEHYGELQGTVLTFFDSLCTRLTKQPGAVPLSTLHDLMNETAQLNPAAKAAVDMAAYDLLGKRLGAPVYELLGLNPNDAPPTSFTIGIDKPDVMARKAVEAAQYPILKVKVGTFRDRENLTAIRSRRPDAIIRVDANTAWRPKEAVRRIAELEEFDLELVEQPVDGRDLEGLGYVRQAVKVPIIADESCIIPVDVPRVAPYVDGINIKLMKCGGIYPALQMIHLAWAHGLSVMMGCMIESSIAITAAAHLAPLLDYADLDGNLLIDDDPYRGATASAGMLRLPAGPGLGLHPAS
jgi:L-alanine-DL-glutamate epimerase-like enolase superfamily enzyme